VDYAKQNEARQSKGERKTIRKKRDTKKQRKAFANAKKRYTKEQQWQK
jgi:hypothetical protein